MSPDNAYGGPVRVAINQAKALMDEGHEVVIYAGYSDYVMPPQSAEGIPLRLYKAKRIVPGAGFAGTFSPGLLTALTRDISSFDLVHVHAARDLVTLPAAAIARRSGLPYVLQTHGMIDPSSQILAWPLDRLLTQRILRDAAAVLYLTDHERLGLEAVAGNFKVSLKHLINGVPGTSLQASQSDHQLEVLYLARLHERKRPALLADVASSLIQRGTTANFRLVGPDEGEGQKVKGIEARTDSSQLTWEGPLAAEYTLKRMQRSSIFVLPSINEPFPMSVLEAMSVGLPVIVTDTCGLSTAITEAEAGLVIDASREALAEALVLLVEDSELRERMSVNAKNLAANSFTMTAVVRNLMEIYRGAISEYQRG